MWIPGQARKDGGFVVHRRPGLDPGPICSLNSPHWCQFCSEVPEGFWLPGYLYAGYAANIIPEALEYLDDVIGLGLGVNAAWHGQPDQFHWRRFFTAIRLAAKHEGADFCGADTTVDVQGDREGLTGVLQWLDMRQHFFRVDKNGVAT